MTEIGAMLYTLSTCAWCRKTKRFFRKRNIPYHFSDIDTLGREDGQKTRDEVVELVGSLQYPVTVINGTAVQGYSPEEFAELLEKAGWKAQG